MEGSAAQRTLPRKWRKTSFGQRERRKQMSAGKQRFTLSASSSGWTVSVAALLECRWRATFDHATDDSECSEVPAYGDHRKTDRCALLWA